MQAEVEVPGGYPEASPIFGLTLLKVLLPRNVNRFRGGLVFKAVSLNSRLESNNEEEEEEVEVPGGYPEAPPIFGLTLLKVQPEIAHYPKST